jgi:hemolysin III
VPDNIYTGGEEIANSITHGIGWIFGIVALVLLVVFSVIYGNAWHIVSTSIYGTTIILLYASSTMYHSLTNRKAKKVFKVLDHSTIYLLIAGSYTPITLVYLRDGWGWPIFFFVWGATILGIALKIIWIDRFKVLSLVLYALMGWCIIFAIPTVIDKVPLEALVLILEGGIAYTVGIPFYIAKKRPYFHTIWHVFVLGGTAFQFFGIFLFIIPIL